MTSKYMKNIINHLSDIYYDLDKLQEADDIQENEETMDEIGELMGEINNFIDTVDRWSNGRIRPD